MVFSQVVQQVQPVVGQFRWGGVFFFFFFFFVFVVVVWRGGGGGDSFFSDYLVVF